MQRILSARFAVFVSEKSSFARSSIQFMAVRKRLALSVFSCIHWLCRWPFSLHRWHLNLKSSRLRNLLFSGFAFFGELLFRLAYQLYQRIYVHVRVHCHNFASITRRVVLTECLSELLPEIDICYPTLAMLRRSYYILWLVLFPTDLPRKLYWISLHYRQFLWHHRGSVSLFFRSPNPTRHFLWAPLLFVSSMCQSCFFFNV